MTEEPLKTTDYKLQHHTFFEETFKMPSLGIAFLKHFLPPELVERLDLVNLTVEQAKLMDDMFRETWPDIVYHVPIIGAEERVSFHVVMEHKSYDDRSAIYQIWKYIGQLCVQDVKNRLTDEETKTLRAWTKDFCLAPIIPIILHHGETAFTGETQLAKLFYPLPGAERFLPHQEAILVDLSMIEKNQLPRDPEAPELHVVLVIMKVIFSKDKELFKRDFCGILEELQPFTQKRRYADLAYMLWHYMSWNAKNMTDTDHRDIFTEVHKNTKIEGDVDMTTLAQFYINEGMERGIAEGIAEGEAKALLRYLTRRFHSIPKSLKEKVFAITDLSRLEELADFAFDCESLEEFTAAL